VSKAAKVVPAAADESIAVDMPVVPGALMGKMQKQCCNCNRLLLVQQKQLEGLQELCGQLVPFLVFSTLPLQFSLIPFSPTCRASRER
jgi:hypothetical protein